MNSICFLRLYEFLVEILNDMFVSNKMMNYEIPSFIISEQLIKLK